MKELKDGWWNLPSLDPTAELCDVQENGTGKVGVRIATHPHCAETTVVQFMDGEYREVATSQLREVQSIDEWCQKRAVEVHRTIFNADYDDSLEEDRDDVRAIRDAMIDAIARYAL